jgi:hypothetical protein
MSSSSVKKDGMEELKEAYGKVLGLRSVESNNRRALVQYLSACIHRFWVVTLPKPDMPLIAIKGHEQGLCRVPHRPGLVFHPSLRWFQADSLPLTSVSDYFMTIVHYCELSGEALWRAMFLLSYFRYRYLKVFPVSNYTIHRLLAVILLVTAKFGEDYPWSNAHFARYAKLTPQELNQLETEFLFLIEFQVFVTNEQIRAFMLRLLNNPEPPPPTQFQPITTKTTSGADSPEQDVFDRNIALVTTLSVNDCFPNLCKKLSSQTQTSTNTTSTNATDIKASTTSAATAAAADESLLTIKKSMKTNNNNNTNNDMFCDPNTRILSLDQLLSPLYVHVQQLKLPPGGAPPLQVAVQHALWRHVRGLSPSGARPPKGPFGTTVQQLQQMNVPTYGESAQK